MTPSVLSASRKDEFGRKESLADSISDASSGETPDSPTHSSSDEDLKTAVDTPVMKTPISLQEKGKIPSSFYVSIACIFLLQFGSGMYQWETVESWWSSVATSTRTTYDYLLYLKDLTNSVYGGETHDPKEYVIAGITTSMVALLVGIFFWAPFLAGVWTGKRATRHKMHRYMGLAFLVQYFLIWVEFLTNYKAGRIGFLPHTLALNGVIQAYSAYFSFKVLPELRDAGYYSDKGVLSRSFIHENVFFQMMCLFGSVYYDSAMRETLQSNLPGRFIELMFLFFPYAVIRPFFPVTSFSSGGAQKKSRSEGLAGFYEIATKTIKIFYLWAKYFLGFHINFMNYLGLITTQNLMFTQGLYLLNVGTVSLSVFLHTLRFKKILPAWFTFSVYLCQIYATFTALPYAIDTFMSHPKLCLVSLAGFLLNMTRSKKLHVAWCFCAMVLLTSTDIEW